MKKWIILLGLLFLLTGCFQKKAYTLPILPGSFTNETEFEIQDTKYTGIKLSIDEITSDQFNMESQTNALADFSLSLSERKYYSCNISFLQQEKEIQTPIHFVEKCNPHAMGPNRYILTIDLPFETTTISCSCNLIVFEEDYAIVISSLEPNLYLSFNLTLDA